MKIYLAGPDVFLPAPVEHGQGLLALCASFGFDGLYPLDGAAALPSAPTLDDARRIYAANVALIRSADAVAANLQDFRGHEPDSGTAFEVGYAVALGLPVWAYGAPSRPIVDQVAEDRDGRDAAGYLIESFGLPRNLMLACSVRMIDGDLRACLTAMRAALPPTR